MFSRDVKICLINELKLKIINGLRACGSAEGVTPMALINEPSGLVKIIKNLLEKGGGWGVSLSSDEHELICFGFSNPNF